MTISIDRKIASERLQKADDVLILCHKNPDGDTIGSAGALSLALRGQKKEVGVLCSDAIPALYDYMHIPIFDESFTPSFVVAVDVAGTQLFGAAKGIARHAENIDLCIDHHASNSGYAYETLLDAAAASTCEIMTDVIELMGVKITPAIADCLYTGIATDTGSFRFSSTTAATHRTAAHLMDLGANVAWLHQRLFENRSRARIVVERYALETLQYCLDGRCAIVMLTRDQIVSSGVAESELEDLTSLPGSIEGVKVGLTLRQQQDGSWRISVRTDGSVDACSIARRMGGGGHLRAAGCEVSGSLDYACHALVDEVKRALDAADPKASPAKGGASGRKA